MSGRPRISSPREAAAEVTASLTYQGVDADMAERIVRFLVELRDGEPIARRASTAGQVPTRAY